MEVDDIHSPQQPASKYSRVNYNGGRLDSSKLGFSSNGASGAGEEDKNFVSMNGGGDVVASTGFGRQWQNSSRIIRVSRASGGKDRHSKVWTAKGARDRRVRLSVNTAIQFYDLQDRLGYDQPSKAVEWLIKAAAESINELPSLNNTNFPPETPRQLTDNQRSRSKGVDLADVELEDGHTDTFVQDQGQQQVGSMSKSGCSSNNSETSKGSGLSLSRTEIRVKARERARERTAKEKENTGPSSMPQSSSFTQLLTAGINNNLKENAGPSSTPSPHRVGSGGVTARAKNEDGLSTLQWSSSSSCTIPMADYFGTALMGLSSSSSRPNNSIQQQLGNGSLPHVMALLPFSGSHEIQHQHQQLPFLPDHHNHPQGAGVGVGSDYNLNFSMSSSSTTSGLAAGFNRGTLQSNSSSPSFLSYLQRFSTTDGASSVPFFLGGAPISPIVDNQHHQQQSYHHDQHHQFNPAGLHLCYGNGSRHSEEKGKGKN